MSAHKQTDWLTVSIGICALILQQTSALYKFCTYLLLTYLLTYSITSSTLSEVRLMNAHVFRCTGYSHQRVVLWWGWTERTSGWQHCRRIFADLDVARRSADVSRRSGSQRPRRHLPWNASRSCQEGQQPTVKIIIICIIGVGTGGLGKSGPPLFVVGLRVGGAPLLLPIFGHLVRHHASKCTILRRKFKPRPLRGTFSPTSSPTRSAPQRLDPRAFGAWLQCFFY